MRVTSHIGIAVAVGVVASLGLTACVAAGSGASPTATPTAAPITLPTEPEHDPYVPSDIIPERLRDQVILWGPDEVDAVVQSSIDGIGWPLPDGVTWDPEAVAGGAMPNSSFEVGNLESTVAFQWVCAWLATWDEAVDAGDTALAGRIEGVVDNFWELPHVQFLQLDGVSFRDQQLAASGGSEDGLYRFLWTTLCP